MHRCIIRQQFCSQYQAYSNFAVKISMVVQRFGVGLVIERSLVRLPGALSSQLGQLSLPSFRGVGKSSTGLHGWG